jgi:hypothetical protein
MRQKPGTGSYHRMMAFVRSVVLSFFRVMATTLACCVPGAAQTTPPPVAPPVPFTVAPAVAPAPKIVLLTTRFRAPLNTAAVLDRLDRYYDEQVGRKLALVLPEISTNHRYDIWHDMWVDFEPLEGATAITLKRPTSADSSRLAKGWMLELAGRLEAPLPLEFHESATMSSMGGDLWASTRDAAKAFDPALALRSLPTWQHAGLLAGSSPLAAIEFAPSALQGIHHVTITSETAGTTRQIWAALQRAAGKPCICSAWSEEAQLDDEVRSSVRLKSDTLAVSASNTLFVPNLNSTRMEQKLREDPEMHNRILAAQGQYSIKYRLDHAYRKATVSWVELTSYNKTDGKFNGERPVGESILATPRMAPPSAAPSTARTKLPRLAPGAYRVRLDAADAAGHIARVDERTYWFDGKVFEEM